MSYFRAAVDAMAGYTPGEQPRSTDVLKLNTNENPYAPAPSVLEAIERTAHAPLALQRYPDPLATSFRDAAAERLSVTPDCILACNGSDDALTILTRACVDPGGLMVSPTPSYPLYEVLARIQDCRFEARPFTADWTLPPDFSTGASLVFVPNPNSPTGTRIEPDELARHASRAACLFVIDEAYVDFAPADAVGLIERCPNVVVTRSLSKSHGLAGIRFGYAVARPEVIQSLIKVKDSYNCNALSIAAATAALRDRTYYDDVRDRVLATRTRMERELAARGFTVTPSHANFVWCRRDEPVRPVFERLRERNVFIRYLTFPDYGDGLRITVGTDEQMDRFFRELDAVL